MDHESPKVPLSTLGSPGVVERRLLRALAGDKGCASVGLGGAPMHALQRAVSMSIEQWKPTGSIAAVVGWAEPTSCIGGQRRAEQ